MNEELQRELVNILRAMKDGSPDAFRVLVEQRSLYCWGQAVLGVLMLVAAYILYLCAKWSAKKLAALPSADDDAAGPLVLSLVVLGIGCIIACGFGVKYIFAIPEAIAPLGRVLEMMR